MSHHTITLKTGTAVLTCKLEHENADRVVAPGSCPHCQHTPFEVRGENRRDAADDRALEADGFCPYCGKEVGLLRVEMNTLFGVKEDRAVLQGRCRVY